MLFLLLCLLTAGLLISFVQKYILRIKEPNIENLWMELENERWYRELLKDSNIENYIETLKEDGFLTDPYYIRKIIDHEGHRDGFINHVLKQTK